jgi:hypothetical protein
MTHKTAAVTLLTLLFLACPVSPAETLKGQLKETGEVNTGGEQPTARHLPSPYFAEVRIIANPALAGSQKTAPYYPALDRDHEANLSQFPYPENEGDSWGKWYERACTMILDNVDASSTDGYFDEDCRISFDIRITADGQMTVACPDADRTQVLKFVESRINWLNGKKYLLFPNAYNARAEARQEVWFRLLVSRQSGSFPKNADYSDCVCAAVREHIFKTDGGGLYRARLIDELVPFRSAQPKLLFIISDTEQPSINLNHPLLKQQ